MGLEQICCVAVLIVILTVLRTDVTYCRDIPDDFVLESKGECHFSNEGRDVKFLDRYFYNMEELVYFDSDVGRYIAKTELGKPDADYWNNDTAIIEERKAAVDRFCRYNYGVLNPFTGQRRVKPIVKVSPMKTEASHMQRKLACYVTGFYPSGIKVKWLRNHVEESSVVSTELLQNGDWTFQILVILEMELQRGETYTCEVEHSSLSEPLQVNWEPQTSESAKNKLLTGIVGFVLGAVFIIVGLIIYLKNKKGTPRLQIPVNEGLMS
ncbi:H-2 class II histocompatibility antigen, E-S beta chain [Microcaecilia unicolor]|uniref:H-2 class II histocompatibility antigen, E-S beta chain-like n=1 Tax=Microcaecilia unicolor TaxID=1415580 RepID=A0A6P7XIS5_9AMPH|nr:H-2 class II histocompatibility antigen, E-S beta chain-like [Microcaecilia unicolor]